MNEIIKGYTAVMPQREEGKMSQFIVRFVDNSSLNIAGEIDDIFKIINSKSKFAHVWEKYQYYINIDNVTYIEYSREPKARPV